MLIRILAIWLFVLAIPLEAKPNTAKIYVWRNEAGVLVFSDSPRPGAEEAEEVNIKTSPNTMPSVDTSVLDIKPKKVSDVYQVEITQPVNDATVRDNTGSVYISGRIKPVFTRGHKIQLYLNNTPYESPQPQAMFILRNVDRGEHQVRMELINDKGKVIASSDSVTFYMHRASKN